MNTFLKNLGAILVLCGVICLAVYYFAVQTNALLITAIVVQLAGILAQIIINKKIN